MLVLTRRVGESIVIGGDVRVTVLGVNGNKVRLGFEAPPAVQFLRERGTDDLTRVTLMSDGASVYECTSNDEVIDLLQGGQGVFGIAIGGVWREIEGTLAELPSERAAEDAEPTPGDELAARRAARSVG